MSPASLLIAVYELARQGVVTRFRFRGAYWRWRAYTAWGTQPPPRREMIRAALEFGRWAHRVRRW